MIDYIIVKLKQFGSIVTNYMKLNKLKTLGNKFSALVVSPIEKLQDNLNQTCKYLVETGNPLLYVSLNKPHDVVKQTFEKVGIDTSRIFFIDCLAKSSDQVSDQTHVIHIENLADLTSLEIAISEYLEKIEGKKSVVIDALATLLIYNSEELTIKFAKSVLQKAQGSRLVVFTPSAKGTSFVQKIGVFFSTIINLEEEN